MAIHSLPADYIVIAMLKVILKTESIEKSYAGGWEVFAKTYELDVEGDCRPSLAPLTSMNYDDLNTTVDELIANGLSPGRDFAVADARQGVLESCEGIQFEERVFGELPRDGLEWIAYCSAH